MMQAVIAILSIVVAALMYLVYQLLIINKFYRNLCNQHPIDSPAFKLAAIIKVTDTINVTKRGDGFWVNDLPVPSAMLPDILKSIGIQLVNRHSGTTI